MNGDWAAARRVGRRAARRVATMVMTLAAAVGCKRDRKPDSGDDAPQFPPAEIVGVQSVGSSPHDTSSFTEGFLYHDGAFYESTGRQGQSLMRKWDPATGKVLREVKIGDAYFGEGLALIGDRLYQLTWQTKIGFVYDTATFRQLSTFTFEGEGWGMTTDGQSLVMSDGTSTVRFIDPRTFAVTRTIEVTDGSQPVVNVNELEWIKGELWANVWKTSRIARIDPKDGHVKGWVDLDGLLPPGSVTSEEAVANGIAYDAATDRLWVTGKLWPKVFQVRVPGVAGDGAGTSAATASPAAAPASGGGAGH
jgi:glutamine cyclotransferase